MVRIIIIFSLCLFVGCNQAEKKIKNNEVNQQIASSNPSENTNDWTILFDGSTLENWRGYLSDEMFPEWTIQDDAMVFTPGKVGGKNIITKEKYTNFILSLECKAGSLYDLIGYPAQHINPAGKWNKCVLEIDHKKNTGTVTMNGKASISFPLSGEKWDAMVANSKFKDWEGFGKYPSGHIGLQDHSDKVWFKNIKIKEI